MNKQEIIDRLKVNKEKSNQFNFFNEDCHEQIDNMISILEQDLDREEAEDQFGFEAAEVIAVLHGDIDIEDILYPEVK